MASKYGLTVCSIDYSDCDSILVKTADRLELRQLGHNAPGPIFVDFVGGKNAHRRQFGGGRNQPLARAIGLKKGALPAIFDVTAGMGKDAFVMATLGCDVTLFERSAVVSALLADGLERALDSEAVCAIAAKMTLIHANAISFLDALNPQSAPDVIYMDPMYPHRQKSAQVKKEMKFFRQLVGDDLDSELLLKSALRVAKRRVAVKRPARSEPLGQLTPDAASASPNTRYDLYFTGGK